MTYNPGDLCRLEKHYGVIVVVHDRCDQYRDGVVTNAATGEVVQP